MNVNNRQRTILCGVLATECHQHHGVDADAADLSRQQRGLRRLRVAQARAGLVPMNLAGWLGREPTNSERVLFHREYLRLEDMGLLERCNLHGGRRTTHLRLTAAGRRMAADLLAEAEDEDRLPPIDLDTIEFAPIEMPDEAPRKGI